MSNHVTLAQLEKMNAEEVSELPLDQLQLLLEDVATTKADAKRWDEKLTAALDMRFSARAQAKRTANGKDCGTVRLTDGDFIIVADLPKVVDWDQPALASAVETVKSWGENPAEYVTVTMKVSETKYSAWPSGIRDQFSPARTVRTGKPTYKIETAKKAAA